MIKNAEKRAEELPAGPDVYGRLLGPIEGSRIAVSSGIDPIHRSEMGQFFTPEKTARLMAGMFENRLPDLRLLDAGAGIGTLTAAWTAALCAQPNRFPTRVSLTAYEIEPAFVKKLEGTLASCAEELGRVGIQTTWDVVRADFIEQAAKSLSEPLLHPRNLRFTSAIVNPPYRKIHSGSNWRRSMRGAGIETGNLYSAFLALIVRLLEPGGELVAISPRSFCNGPYFRSFRKLFLDQMSLRRIHVFDSRNQAFREDKVLQENIIFHAVKDRNRTRKVIIASSYGPDDPKFTTRKMHHDKVVRPADPDAFIRIVPDHAGDEIAGRVESLSTPLAGLRLEVSTGRVVDFRAREFLRSKPSKATVPLIYPAHLSSGFVHWPRMLKRKCEAIVAGPKTDELLVPSGWYVLVKRFSAKEEKRRVTAAVFDPSKVSFRQVGFENHLNYYHRSGSGVTENLAKGLATFLNSTLVDSYFRQFSGHTQVNAADLRRLPYPPLDLLERLGRQVKDTLYDQVQIDRLVKSEHVERGRGQES